MAPKPTNPTLYARVKAEAKRRFKVWPSAYGSAWLVKTYKKRGGNYSGSISGGGLSEWFSQNHGTGWVDCKTGKPCGRKSATDHSRPYPACRPRLSQCRQSAVRRKDSPKRVRWAEGAKQLVGGKDMSYCKCSGPTKTRGFSCRQHCQYGR